MVVPLYMVLVLQSGLGMSTEELYSAVSSLLTSCRMIR
jgi:hypothetical protein